MFLDAVLQWVLITADQPVWSVERDVTAASEVRADWSGTFRASAGIDEASQLRPRLSLNLERESSRSWGESTIELTADLRSRARSRNEVTTSLAPNGTSASLRTGSDTRTGQRVTGEWRGSFNSSDGQRVSGEFRALDEETEVRRSVSSPDTQTPEREERAGAERFDGAIDYLAPRGSDWRVSLRASASSESERRTSASADDDIVPDPGDARAYRAEETEFRFSPRLTRRLDERHRLQFRLDVERGTRTNRITRETVISGLGTREARISETRIEPGAEMEFRYPGGLWFETRLDVEISALETTSFGQVSTTRSAFWKPRLSVERDVGAQRWTAWLTRSASNLDFDAFDENVDELDEFAPLVLADLRPQTEWRSGASWRWRDDDVQFGFEVEYSDISDLIDVVGGPEGTTVRGNLWSASSWEVNGFWERPFRLPQITSGTFRLTGTWTDTSVFDPLLGRDRAFDDQAPFELTARLNVDLPVKGAELTVDSSLNGERVSVQSDRLDRESESDPLVDVRVDYALNRRHRLSFGVSNVLDTADILSRTRYRGEPRLNDVRRLETRERREGRLFSIELRSAF